MWKLIINLLLQLLLAFFAFLQLLFQHFSLLKQDLNSLDVLVFLLLTGQAVTGTKVSLQFLLLLLQHLYLLPLSTWHKRLKRKKIHRLLTMLYRCSFYSLLFADLFPGLHVVGLQISFHDPELSLQFGYLFYLRTISCARDVTAVSIDIWTVNNANTENLTCSININLTVIWACACGWSSSRHGCIEL